MTPGEVSRIKQLCDKYIIIIDLFFIRVYNDIDERYKEILSDKSIYKVFGMEDQNPFEISQLIIDDIFEIYNIHIIQDSNQKTIDEQKDKGKNVENNPAFSPKERNTLGYLIARYLWGNVISDIMQSNKEIICFVDEAGVKKSPPKNSRGYLSVTPVVIDDFSNYNTDSSFSQIW